MTDMNTYLETLVSNDNMQKTAQIHLGRQNVIDLAKSAGINLAENVCTKCASVMVKTGSIYRCECGMMKKASKMTQTRREKLPAKSFAVPESKAKKIGVSGEIKGEAKGKYPIPDKAHARNALARVSQKGTPAEKSMVRAKVHSKFPDIGKDKEAAMGKCSECGMEKHETEDGVKCGCGVKVGMRKMSMSKVATVINQLYDLHDGDIMKVAAICDEVGMDKEAIMPILRALGRTAKSAWRAGGAALKAAPEGASAGAKAMSALKAGGGAAGRGLSRTGRVAKAYGGRVGRTFQAARQGGAGVGGAALQTAMKHPELAATAVGAGGLGAYALGRGQGRQAQLEDIYKRGSAEIEIMDKAGRVIAKMAAIADDNTPIPMDELQESFQEAQSREDIPGRGKRWAAGLGTLGALGGGAGGYGLGHLIGPKAALVGAGIGALGGGTAGVLGGKAHGEEEARADKALSMLRALRAHRMGAASGARAGYVAGLRRGYGMSQGGGGEEGSAPQKVAFSVTEEGHKYDAARARLRAAHAAKMVALAQKHEGMGSAQGTGSFLKTLRGFGPEFGMDPRHEEYVARKHEAGENAWNPFGGLLTPSSQEEGGTRWRYGKFKQPKEE